MVLGVGGGSENGLGVVGWEGRTGREAMYAGMYAGFSPVGV